MMYPCKECYEQQWRFRKIEDTILAECMNCGYDVEFPAKPFKQNRQNEDRCRNCFTPLQVKVSKFKQNKLNKPYYFTHTLSCPKCKKMYLSEKYKVYNKMV